MLRKFVGAAVVLVLVGGLAMSEDKPAKKPSQGDKNAVHGLITKVTDKDVTIHVHKKGEEKGKTTTYAHSGSVKVFHVTGTKKDHKREPSTIAELKSAIAASTGKHKGVHGHIHLDKDGDRATSIYYHTGKAAKPGKPAASAKPATP